MIDKQYIDKLLRKMSELETELADPATAANQNKFRKLVREHSALKKIEEKASRYFHIQDNLKENNELINSDDSDQEFKELAKQEADELEKALPLAEKDLMITLIPPDEDNERNSIIEIRAGTGGDEAALFAGDLHRMYCRYAELKGWKTNIIDASPCEIGGYKEIVFRVEGDKVYGTLRYEMGVHRVQRVPLTESSGRIHTSASTVAVFPEAEAEDNIAIDPEDLRIDTFRAGGAGGQHVNTTDSAIRITHIPTGIVVQSQDERSQHRNKDKAMSVLKTRILDVKRREEAEKKGAARRSQIGSGDRSERIRTYNFPQNRLTDHRINLTLYSLDRVMEGTIDELVNALREDDARLRLEAELGNR